MHWRRKWHPTPVFLSGESQGRGSLVGCHLWGRTESDMTDRLNNNSKCGHEEILSSVLTLKTCSSWHEIFYTEKLSVKHYLHASFIFAHVLFRQSTQCIGEDNGTLLQYSCLENAMDGGAW